MTDQPKWLGVDAVDGARVGPLALRVEQENDVFGTGPSWEASVYLCEPHDNLDVVRWCPLSEVDTKTREWLRSLAALMGPAVLPDEVEEMLAAGHDVAQQSSVPTGWKALDRLCAASQRLLNPEPSR